MYSVTQYAKEAGLTRRAVIKRIHSGLIKEFKKVGNTYIIMEEPKKKLSFDEVKERYYGEEGTPKRDALEEKIKKDIEKQKKKE